MKEKHESTPIRPKVVASAGKRIATVQGLGSAPRPEEAPIISPQTGKG